MLTLADARIRPLDLILLRGVNPVARAMRNARDRDSDPALRSHVGLAITREVLDLPCLEPGRIYLWESVHKTPCVSPADQDRSRAT